MPKDTMTPKERWLAVLQRKKPDRIPMDYWATPEATQNLLKHLKVSDFDAAAIILHIDTPLNVGPKYTGPKFPKGTDVWGCKYKTVKYKGGEYSEISGNPLAAYETAEDIKKNYKFPEAGWWDYSDIPKQIKGKEDRIVRGGEASRF